MARHPNRDRARELRTNMTPAERFVWYRIRYRQLGGYKFRRQQPIGPYIVDFACLERKFILELDGGQHADVQQVEYDARRTVWLEEQGYRVYRLWNIEAVGEWDASVERIGELLREGEKEDEREPSSQTHDGTPTLTLHAPRPQG